MSSDYYADPPKYPNLQTVQCKNNIVTDDDCLSSRYTKVEQKINQEWVKNLKKQLGLPVEERDVAEQAIEDLFNTTVKTTWDVVGPMVNTVGNLASIDTIQDMVKGVTDAMDGIVKLMSTKVDEKALDEKLAQQDAQKAKAKSDVDFVKSMKSSVGKSFDAIADAAGEAADSAKKQLSAAASAVKDSAKDMFKNMKMPEMPDDIKQTFTDTYDAIILVMNNINSIYIVLILKLIGKILDCFKEIIDVLGVPTIPDPLGRIPQLIADAKQVMLFVLGLPVTLINCIKSIAKKKVKALQVANLPTPPEPVQTKTPVPPTSEDVQMPDLTWDDVKDKLVETYEFSEKDASDIVKDIQEFYDGSGKKEPVITGAVTDEVTFEDGRTRVEYLPDSKKMERAMVQPTLCYNAWLDQNVYDYTIGGEEAHSINLPHKGEYGSNVFYEYSDYDTKEYYDASKDFGIHIYSSSDSSES